jgi:hypothetical protein
MQASCTGEIIQCCTKCKCYYEQEKSIDIEREPKNKQKVDIWNYKLVQWRHFIQDKHLKENE